MVVSSFESIDEEVKKSIGKSWFEIEEEQRGNSYSITRILFLSLLHDDYFDVSEGGDVSNIIKLHNFFCSVGVETAGGVVLLSNDRGRSSPNSALGFLEMSNENEDYPGTLSDLGNLGFHSIRVLLVHTNCSHHDFAPFGVYYACPPNEDAFDIENEDKEAIFTDIMGNIRKCSKSLAESEEHPQCTYLKILKGAQRKSMPSAERISSIAQCDLYPSLEEFLDFFNSPLDAHRDKASPLLPLIEWDEVRNIIDEMENEDS